MVRRTLQDAFTPDKLAFIKRGAGDSKPDSEAKPAEHTKTIDLEDFKGTEDEKPETKVKNSRRTHRERPELDATAILDEVLVPVTIRVPRRTSQALKRAYLEQKLKNAKPDTLQEVGKQAFDQWLARNG